MPEAVGVAITETARRLREIIDEHGPDAVSLYVSAPAVRERVPARRPGRSTAVSAPAGR
ncbi:hypothetical protein [Streptomyces canus]|uniref:hypothetical protein n=1 Tax=Streptomyces canus TaxID=58343 RepID=UPI003247D34E